MLLVNPYPVNLFVVVLQDFLVYESPYLLHRVEREASLVASPYRVEVASLVAYPAA